MAIYNYDKEYRMKTIGGQISFLMTEKLGSINTDTILRILCVSVDNAGVCQKRQIFHGNPRNPSKVIIDKTQYDNLMSLTNPA